MWVVPAREESKIPRVVRSTVLVHRRRCGKPNCRCVTGEAAHESTVLSYKEAGKTRFLMLPAAEVEAVPGEWPGGTSPPGSRRTRRKSLDLPGSHRPTFSTRNKVPMSEELGLVLTNSLQPRPGL